MDGMCHCNLIFRASDHFLLDIFVAVIDWLTNRIDKISTGGKMLRSAFIWMILMMLGIGLLAQDIEWETHTSETFGYEVQYPKGWMMNVDDENGLFTVSLMQTEMGMPVVIAVMVAELTEEDKDKGYDEYSESSLKEMLAQLEEQGMAKVVVEKQGETELAGNKAFMVEVSASMMDFFDMKTQAVHTLHQEKLYAVSITSDIDKYKANLPVFEKILKSFSFK